MATGLETLSYRKSQGYAGFWEQREKLGNKQLAWHSVQSLLRTAEESVIPKVRTKILRKIPST